MKFTDLKEGYRTLPNIDTNRYGDRSGEGLEGPFRAENGKVVYYDAKAGMYYDPDTDFYLSNEEWEEMNESVTEGSLKVKGTDLHDLVVSMVQDIDYSDTKTLADIARTLGKEVFYQDDKVVLQDPDFDQFAEGDDYLKNKIGRASDERDVGTDNWEVKIDGKPWKVFRNKSSANQAASTIQMKYGKKTEVYATRKPVSEDIAEAKEKKYRVSRSDTAYSTVVSANSEKQAIEKAMYADAGNSGASQQKFKDNARATLVKEEVALTEAQFDEAAGEKDACYHKVKSRYKVWPSAYASGALVKCRKVGAKNWGNKK